MSEDEEVPIWSSSMKKKKKKVVDVDDVGNDTSYEYLVHRIYEKIGNPTEITKLKIPPPSISKDGVKRVVWTNFTETCQIMGRSPDHVKSYFLAETGTVGSINEKGQFIIKGRYQSTQIKSIIRHYLSEYVFCKTCKSERTTINYSNRLIFLVCDKCKSQRTIPPIKTGYLADLSRRKK